MKIRNGFVSNSSSSSFLIYGAFIDSDKASEVFGEDWMDSYSLEKDHPEFKGWEISCGPDGSDGLYIGKSWDSIEDNQTGKQFKEEIESVIKKYFGVECSTHSAAWYNG